MKNFKERVIIALDYNNLNSVKDVLERLKGEAFFYKIGSELFTSCGNQSIELVRDYGCKVFLDLKFHDIPNTVYNAVKSAGELGVDIINVHASGGGEMMKSAKQGGVDATKKTGKKIDIIAVTILTNLAEEDVMGIFYHSEDGCGSAAVFGNIVDNLVLHLARLAKISGLDGVVCSGHESLKIKKVLGDGFKTITPGIRLKKSSYMKDKDICSVNVDMRIDDQKRVMTPFQAFSSKADYIVVGREVTASNNPLEALKTIYRDVERVPILSRFTDQGSGLNQCD